VESCVIGGIIVAIIALVAVTHTQIHTHTHIVSARCLKAWQTKTNTVIRNDLHFQVSVVRCNEIWTQQYVRTTAQRRTAREQIHIRRERSCSWWLLTNTHTHTHDDSKKHCQSRANRPRGVINRQHCSRENAIGALQPILVYFSTQRGKILTKTMKNECWVRTTLFLLPCKTQW